MAIYKRGRIFWCEWEVGGKRIRETTGTTDRKAAQEYHDRRRSDLWRQTKVGDVRIPTWDEAALAWIDDHAQHKRSFETDRLRLLTLNPMLTGKSLSELDAEGLMALRKDLMKDSRSHATVNRYLSLVSAVLHHTHAKGNIGSVPKINFLPEPKQRFRWLTKDEARRLIAELPDHLADMTRLALATGLRRSNITGLTWHNVDIDRRIAWIWPDEAKAGKPIAVPLNDDALAVLKRRIADGERDSRYVFTYRGNQINHVTTKAWVKALERAGIEAGFRFHDLRHTWASWHVMAGTPLEVLRQLGGWADMTMVLRYAHLSPSYVAGYVGNASLTISPTEENGGSENEAQLLDSLVGRAGIEPATNGLRVLTKNKKAA